MRAMSSPAHSLDSNSSSFSVDESSNGEAELATTKCPFCRRTLTLPKVLPCFHTFCQTCIEEHLQDGDRLNCTVCRNESIVPPLGVAALNTDYAVLNLLEAENLDSSLNCTGCKSKESNAVAKCYDCVNLLCSNCVMAHQFMHCFEGHHVLSLTEKEDGNGTVRLRIADRCPVCPRHKNESLRYFCRTCSTPICKECTVLEHPKGIHEYEYLAEVSSHQLELLNQLVSESRTKSTELRSALKAVEHVAAKLNTHFSRAQVEIEDTFRFYKSAIEERRIELLNELESVHNAKQAALTVLAERAQEAIDRIQNASEFLNKITKYASGTEILMFKKAVDTRLAPALAFSPDPAMPSAADLEFVSNYQAIQAGVRNTFGYIRSSPDPPGTACKQPPIARPSLTTTSGISALSVNGERAYMNGRMSPFNSLLKRFSSPTSLTTPSFVNSLSDIPLPTLNPYEKWSNGGPDSSLLESFSHSPQSEVILELHSKLNGSILPINKPTLPPSLSLKRQKMTYHCKFGEFGILEGQFTEPSGVAVAPHGDILVADTNNHRIQVFDREGRFKFQFGECGKRDGQLLYPNRVSAVRSSGDIVVTERAPTHQVQLYNQYGQFVRKFGASVLQHPRGVCVDSRGRIVVVECKVMRVLIFDQLGDVLHKFGCSRHLEFPNGVVVNDRQEIFISDNRAHCVKVFNYEGTYLRQIGGEGITNFPIGVGLNSAGEILIADNHNNFNLTIFTQEGQLVGALESRVKHAQCFDVALMDDGSVVLASKDYRLYIYRYVQVSSITSL